MWKGRKGPKSNCLRADYSTIFQSSQAPSRSFTACVCVFEGRAQKQVSLSWLLNTIRGFHRAALTVPLCWGNSTLTDSSFFFSHPESSTAISSKGSECATGCKACKFFRILTDCYWAVSQSCQPAVWSLMLSGFFFRLFFQLTFLSRSLCAVANAEMMLCRANSWCGQYSPPCCAPAMCLETRAGGSHAT